MSDPKHWYGLGTDLMERSSVEKDLKVLVDNRLSTSHAHTHVGKKTNGVLGWIRKCITSRSREGILPL